MRGKIINKPLFNLEEKSNRKMTIVFTAIISLLIVFTVALFPTFEKLIQEIPETLRNLITMTTIAEYFNAEAVEIWIMLVSVFGAVLAINITTNEFKNGSYELIYTLNMSRQEIVRTKLLRLVVNVIFVNLVCFIVSLISLLIFGIHQFSVVNLLIYTLLAIVVTLQVSIVIFSLGLLNKSHFNMFGGIITVVLMYIFTTSADVNVNGKLDWIGYFSPMSTMNGTIMTNGFKGIATNGILLAVWTIICAVLLFASAKKFENDDLC